MCLKTSYYGIWQWSVIDSLIVAVELWFKITENNISFMPRTEFCKIFTPPEINDSQILPQLWVGCWVNFQFRSALLIWIIVQQGPTALAVDALGGCLDVFSLIYHFCLLSPSLWETAQYRLKYCLKGLLNQNNQPTYHSD